MKAIKLAAVLLGVGFAMNMATAQEYPTKPITMIVPFAPGGTNDLVGRPLAQALSKSLGKQVIAENIGGAGGTIGAGRAAAAAPDGYTLLIGSAGPLATAPNFYARLPYDPVKSFSPISLVMTSPVILLVNPSVPANSVKDLIRLAKSRPGELTYCSPGTGSMNHLAGELFDLMAHVRMTHVPYKGSGPAVIDFLAGRIDLMFAPVAPTLPYVKAGKLRALAVGTKKRFSVLPELPTISESGVPGYDVSQWWGMLAPAKTPRSIIDKLNAEIVKILSSPQISGLYVRLGGEPTSSSPAEFETFIRDENRKWAGVIAKAHIPVHK